MNNNFDDDNMNNNLENNTSGNDNIDNTSVHDTACDSDDISSTVIHDVEYTPVIDNNTGYNYSTGTADMDKKPKKQKTGKKSFGSYIAVALICSIIGGSVGTGIGYGIMKNSFDSAIADVRKEIKAGNAISSTNTSLSSVGGIDIPTIVDNVSDAVVGVSTKSVTTNVFGFGSQEQEGLGSGVIFSDEGYVLTNYHVIEGANQVKVILSTGKEVDAKVVNYDQNADLAVVKITEDMEMPGVAELGDSDNIKAGEQVIAIGNPLGKEYLGTVTTGIISAVSREVQSEDGATMNAIQTDTAINAGNSGGPLINSQGQVIGINTAKISGSGVEGIGFAIPINAAKEKLDVLVKQKITLGISVIDVTEALSKQYNLPVGIFIKNVQDFSIAQKGGLQAGDVITKLGGKTVKTTDELNEVKSQYNDGDTMEVEFVRNGQTMTASLVAQ